MKIKIKTKMDMIKAFAKLENICFTHLEALNDFADFDYKPIAVLEAEFKATGKLDFGDAERENYDVFTEWLVDLMKDDEHWNIPNLSEGLATHFPDWKDYLVFGMEEELAWEMVGKLTNAFPRLMNGCGQSFILKPWTCWNQSRSSLTNSKIVSARLLNISSTTMATVLWNMPENLKRSRGGFLEDV